MRPDFDTELPFVNRRKELAAFEKAGFATPPDGCRVLSYVGMGGQGKSSLLSRLASDIDGANKALSLISKCTVTFGDNDSPKNPDRFLIRLRNQLFKAGFEFPGFDYAVMLHWAENYNDETPPALEQPFLVQAGIGEDSDELASGVITETGFEVFGAELLKDVVDEIPGVRFLVGQGRKWLVHRARFRVLKNIRSDLNMLLEDDGVNVRPGHQLRAAFPHMFVADINRQMARHKDRRIALLIDNFDRIEDNLYGHGRFEENPFEKCLKTIFSRTNGLFACFFLSELPDWLPEFCEDEDITFEQFDLDGLAPVHADQTLMNARVTSRDIRAVMVQNSKLTRNDGAKCYPELLEIFVAHWDKILGDGDTPTAQDFELGKRGLRARLRAMTKRVLGRYAGALHELIVLLATSNQFDDRIAQTAADYLGIPKRPMISEVLAGLSFVSRKPDGWMSIHRPVQLAILETIKAAEKDTNRELMFQWLVEHTNDLKPATIAPGQLPYFSEAINIRRLMGMNGFVDWMEAFVEPLEMGNHAEFLEVQWRQALAWASNQADIDPLDISTCLNEMASFQQQRGNLEGVVLVFEQALEECRKSTRASAARLAIALNNLGHALMMVGETDKAREKFDEAIDMLVSEPTIGSELVKPFENPELVLANAHNHLCECWLILDNMEKAREHSEHAFNTFPDAYKETPYMAPLHNNRATLEYYGKAYQKALDGFSEALALFGNTHPGASLEAANCQTNIANCYDELDQLELGSQHHFKALEILDTLFAFPNQQKAECYYEISWNFHARGKAESSLEYMLKAVEEGESCLYIDTQNLNQYKELATQLESGS